MSAAHEEEWALDAGLEQPDPNANEANEAAEAPQLTEVEKLAAKYGWKPESAWKGDKSTWTPAEQYIETAFQKREEATSRARDTSRNLRQSQRAYEDLQARMDRLTNATNQLMSDQERRHRQEIEDYFESKRFEAAKEGKQDLWEELGEQKREAHQALDQKFRKEPEIDYTRQAQAMLDDPVVGKFLKDHPWVVQDEEIYAYAFAVAEDLAQAGHPKSMQIRAVKEMLRQEFPEKFEKPQQRRAATAFEDGEEDELETPPNFDAPEEKPQREQRAHDERGRFVPDKDAHLYQRRPAPQVAAGSRLPASARATPEQKAWAALPEEARRIYTEQKKSGSIKMDLVTYAKLYNGEPVDVL